MDNLIFVDTETTGLDPDRHEIWEVAAIEGNGTEHHWFLSVDLTKADLIALNIGGFFERFPRLQVSNSVSTKIERPASPYKFAEEFMFLTQGKHLVGAVPDFDAQRLASLLRRFDALPAWHYHLICIENLIAGAFKLQPPWKSDDLFTALDLDRNAPEFAKHTALGDARLVRAAYIKLFSLDHP